MGAIKRIIAQANEVLKQASGLFKKMNNVKNHEGTREVVVAQGRKLAEQGAELQGLMEEHGKKEQAAREKEQAAREKSDKKMHQELQEIIQMLTPVKPSRIPPVVFLGSPVPASAAAGPSSMEERRQAATLNHANKIVAEANERMAAKRDTNFSSAA